MQASNLIASQDVSVMALGGFLGTDPASTVDSIADLVAKGEVRYFMPTAAAPERSAVVRARDQTASGVGARRSLPTATATSRRLQLQRNGNGNGTFTPPPNFNGNGNGTPPNFNGAGGAGAVPNDNSAIMSVVRAACTALTTSTNPGLPSEYSGQIYDCQGKAAALRNSAVP